MNATGTQLRSAFVAPEAELASTFGTYEQNGG
jgi:hypothetical protein